MRKVQVISVVCAALATILIDAVPADAQLGRRLRNAAGRAAEREVTRQVENRVTNAVRCVMDDHACIEAAEKDGRPVEITDGSGNVVERPVAFVNFDFTPGDRVLFADDFSRDQVGNFPQRLEFERGNMELAEWDSGRWLRGTSWPSAFMVPLSEALPDRFTVEMEVVPGQGGQHMEILFSERPEHFVTARYFQRKINAGVSRTNGAVSVGNTQDEFEEGTPFMLRIMVDGGYVKVYAGGTRVANMPNAVLGRANRIWIRLPGSDGEPGYVRNIRVAAGGRQLYDALSESGRVATQGIYFDTGSDRIKPESAPTLRQIGDMLRQHGELRLKIEGHTDNVGSAEANMQLSQRRAASVKAYLEREFGIDGGRLEAAGLGATVPAASNDTQEGRQQNRRVELVRL